VDTSINFFVWVHPKIRKEDFQNLPDDLQKHFDSIFLRVLAVDPYSRRGLRGHLLKRELDGYQTIDIGHLGVEYRIIYHINDSPEIMKVSVYTFERHDPAYERAKQRALGWI
jgi:mRNA interferase RelE/StbE